MRKSIDGIRSWLGSGAINVFGLPFSGKDTVGQRLAGDLSATFLSSGAILREAEETDRALAEELGRGQLASTDKFRDIVLPYFYQGELAGKPLVLSSVGRWQGEERAVLEALEKSGHPMRAVIYLKITEQELQTRWQTAKDLADRGGRSDDENLEILEKRLTEFQEKTVPVLNYYREQSLLVEIDGEGTRDAVYERVLVALGELASRA